MENSKEFSGDAPIIINMTEAKSTEKVCVELLADALKNPIVNSRQSYYILERLALCFVSVARDVKNLTVEVYGNGTPGGLKEEVRAIRKEIAELNSMVLEDRKTIKTNRESEEQHDWFRSVVKWFVNNVLPHLVTALLSLIASALFWFAATGGN